MSYEINRIKRAYNKATHIKVDAAQGLVIISDCHRGSGTWADNFLPNRPIYIAALKYYYQKNYTYIELGDGDELWENRSFEEIRKTHSEVFSLFSLFARDNRLFLIHGNHDKVLARDGRKEALIIERAKTPLFMIHGHQGDLINDSLWQLSRWLVRYLWKPLELRGFRNPTSAAKNNVKLRKAEARYMKFSCDNHCILIAGHTHRPMLSVDEKCGMYFNSGSCVHPGAITAIEILGDMATLVKWSICARDDMSLYICREIIARENIEK